jgi:acetyl-CoA hydrolase
VIADGNRSSTAPSPRSGGDVGPDLSPYIKPGDALLWGQAHAEPVTLIRALIAQRAQFSPLRVFLGIGQSGLLTAEHADAFRFTGYCGSGPNRVLAKAGLLDVLPCHYTQLSALIDAGTIPLDVLMLQLSPPDEEGRHSLGLAREYLVAAVRKARVIIGEVNPRVPWTHGGPYLQPKDVDLLIDSDAPLPSVEPGKGGAAERAIGAHVAGLIADGATVQTGIGSLPDAILDALDGHRDIGLHTGAAGDAVARLAEAGVINNSRKTIDRGIGVAGVLIGGAALHRYAHRNPALEMRASDYTHGLDVIAKIDNFVSINSAIEVDLTGQVNAEVAGDAYVGAIGGALDFARGAQRSRGGIAITALPSTAGARSRIVANLSGPVTLPRSDVGVIVTEHGVADLRGATLSERVRRLIAIAAPEHREQLARDAHAQLRRQGAPL